MYDSEVMCRKKVDTPGLSIGILRYDIFLIAYVSIINSCLVNKKYQGNVEFVIIRYFNFKKIITFKIFFIFIS